jgi:hypothetical protein
VWVALGVSEGFVVGVSVAVGEAPSVGVSVGVGEGPSVGVSVWVGEGVSVGVSVAVAVSEGVAVAVSVSVTVGVSVGIGVSVEVCRRDTCSSSVKRNVSWVIGVVGRSLDWPFGSAEVGSKATTPRASHPKSNFTEGGRKNNSAALARVRSPRQ